MKSIDVKLSTYTDFDQAKSNEDPKFKVGDHARMSKYANIFAKNKTSNWSEEIFATKQLNILKYENAVDIS